jgi:hypothetical protein
LSPNSNTEDTGQLQRTTTEATEVTEADPGAPEVEVTNPESPEAETDPGAPEVEVTNPESPEAETDPGAMEAPEVETDTESTEADPESMETDPESMEADPESTEAVESYSSLKSRWVQRVLEHRPLEEHVSVVSKWEANVHPLVMWVGHGRQCPTAVHGRRWAVQLVEEVS